MGKFVNQNGKIRVMMVSRTVHYYVCRSGKGIFIGFTILQAIGKRNLGLTTQVRHNYANVNRIVKQNPTLRLRDQQPDGLLILQQPIQGKLPL